jgi:hypothetical protein
MFIKFPHIENSNYVFASDDEERGDLKSEIAHLPASTQYGGQASVVSLLRKDGFQ